jgi:lipopolysaccharide export system permease protein
MWLRDGDQIVNIQLPLLSANRGRQSVEFKDVVIYRFARGVDLASITRARSAGHDERGWTLQDVAEVRFDPAGATVERHETLPWRTEVRPELLDSAVTRPKRLSMRSLAGYLDYLEENGLDDTVYQAAFWEKVVFPFSALALVLAGMPFVFSSTRTQNVGVRMFIGMVLGGLFLILSRMAQNLGDAYHFPAMLSNGIPPLLLAAIAIQALRRSV